MFFFAAVLDHTTVLKLNLSFSPHTGGEWYRTSAELAFIAVPFCRLTAATAASLFQNEIIE